MEKVLTEKAAEQVLQIFDEIAEQMQAENERLPKDQQHDTSEILLDLREMNLLVLKGLKNRLLKTHPYNWLRTLSDISGLPYHTVRKIKL